MGKHTFAIFVLVAIGLIIAGCAKTQQPQSNISGDIIDISGTVESSNATSTKTTADIPPTTQEQQPLAETKPRETQDPFKNIKIPDEYKGITIKKFAIEGDKVALKPVAVDPDNDKITYSFTKPFDSSGTWQTKVGDAGFYKILVTASDGKASTTENVLVVIKAANRAPVLTCPTQVLGKEGDLITLDCKATDPEGEDVVLEYAGWMTKNAKQTGFDDKGTHLVNVTATDTHGAATKATVKVIIENTNRPPEIEDLKGITVTEEDLVKVIPQVSDLDGDKTTVTYAKPLDAKGEWQTKKGDRGTYYIDITVSDGVLSTTKKVKVTVNKLNSPPALKHIDDIVVSEGDTITLPIDASDPDGDKVITTVSGWMSGPAYTTTYEDAGTYTVIVTASDGSLEASQSVKVTVKDKNRPPIFKIPA